MHVLAVGSVHQSHEMFGEESRGRQCGFMALCSILYELNNPVTTWSANTIDDVIEHGDSLYFTALHSQVIPDVPALSLTDLLTVVRWSSNRWSVVTCCSVNDSLTPSVVTNDKSAVVVEETGLPVAETNRCLPVVVEPLTEAKSTNNVPVD